MDGLLYQATCSKGYRLCQHHVSDPTIYVPTRLANVPRILLGQLTGINAIMYYLRSVFKGQESAWEWDNVSKLGRWILGPPLPLFPTPPLRPLPVSNLSFC